MKQLSNGVKTTIAITPTEGVAAATDLEGAVLDMANFNGVRISVLFGTITAGAVTTIKAQQGDESDGSDMADLEGTSQTVAVTDDDEMFQIDVTHPQKRYVQLYIDRATQNAVVGGAWYDQYRGRTQPVSQGTGVTVEVFDAPDEGTA